MFLDHIKELEQSKRLMSTDDVMRNDPIVLAYIGDTIFDLYIRTRLAFSGDYKAGALHRMSVKFVSAAGQNTALLGLSEILKEDEQYIVRRARNMKMTPPKNCDLSVYTGATSFEALCGYLYLSSHKNRLLEILNRAYETIDAD